MKKVTDPKFNEISTKFYSSRTAPLSAPPNIAIEEMSAIRDDLASSVSTCPDISSACSAPHNIAIDLLYNAERCSSGSIIGMFGFS